MQQQPVISPRVAVTLVIALCGFAGWLDRPVEDLGAESGPVVSEGPGMHSRCVAAGPETSASRRASRPQPESFAHDSNASAELDLPDAALLRCRIVN